MSISSEDDGSEQRGKQHELSAGSWWSSTRYCNIVWHRDHLTWALVLTIWIQRWQLQFQMEQFSAGIIWLWHEQHKSNGYVTIWNWSSSTVVMPPFFFERECRRFIDHITSLQSLARISSGITPTEILQGKRSDEWAKANLGKYRSMLFQVQQRSAALSSSTQLNFDVFGRPNDTMYQS